MRYRASIWKTLLIGAIAGIALELFVFNFRFFRQFLVTGVQEDVPFSAEEMEFLNWTQTQDGHVSGMDPIIAIFSVDRYVQSVRLTLDMSEDTVPMNIFYTTEEGEVFTGEKMIAASAANGENTVEVGVYVRDLRIDLGETEGLLLRGIDLVLIGNELDFSVARAVAVLVIVAMERLLFSLQRSPGYEDI